jgi:hypothetical protein
MGGGVQPVKKSNPAILAAASLSVVQLGVVPALSTKGSTRHLVGAAH